MDVCFDIPVHPMAELLPLTTDGLAELAEQIRRDGLKAPVTLRLGAILDGRRRYLACRHAGVAPQFVEWDGPGGPRENAYLFEFVMRRNLARHRLNPSQMAMAAAKVSARAQGGKPARGMLSMTAAGVFMGLSKSQVGKAMEVRDAAVPEVIAAIDEGRLSVYAAVRLMNLPPAEQADEARAAGYVPEPVGSDVYQRNAAAAADALPPYARPEPPRPAEPAEPAAPPAENGSSPKAAAAKAKAPAAAAVAGGGDGGDGGDAGMSDDDAADAAAARIAASMSHAALARVVDRLAGLVERRRAAMARGLGLPPAAATANNDGGGNGNGITFNRGGGDRATGSH